MLVSESSDGEKERKQVIEDGLGAFGREYLRYKRATGCPLQQISELIRLMLINE